jgi:hypothetical protein
MKHNDQYKQLVAECAEQGATLQRFWARQGAPVTLYLYCRPSTPGNPGKLILAREDAPEAHLYQLVCAEGLRTNVPYTDYFQWIYDRARHAPVLSTDQESTNYA